MDLLQWKVSGLHIRSPDQQTLIYCVWKKHIYVPWFYSLLLWSHWQWQSQWQDNHFYI